MEAIPQAWTWLTSGSSWSGGDGIAARLSQHVFLSLACLAISCVLALPVALLLGHIGRGGVLAVNISNAGRAVPTFAVLVLLLLSPIGQDGQWPTIIALVLFAVPPLITNAYVGMREVDRDVVEAARGMGMSGRQMLWRVELPLAFPLVMTGVRSATVQVVATATLAALPGGGGLGRLITAGFARGHTYEVVGGALLVALLALLLEGVFVLLQRYADPLRRRPARRVGRDDPAGGANPGGPLDDSAPFEKRWVTE